MRSVLILGSTGSIGTQTLELVRTSPASLCVAGLAARRSAAALLAQIREFRPPLAALTDEEAAASIRSDLPQDCTLLTGPEALLELIEECRFDVAVHGVVGSAGVWPSVKVLERGKTLALANKESLVVAGAALIELSRRHQAPILPVDSEHSAIFQCLAGQERSCVRCVYLTASGGPLRDIPLADLARVRPETALEHPNWEMGPRISIGSATLMNKALEVVEAHHLFGLASEQIRVVVHRQSVVHSMVEFVDGSILAQMGPPDMCGPIHHALHHPKRAPSALKGFDFALFRELTFEPADPARFPALELGYRCILRGGSSGAALNAADEVAVEAFLQGRIAFPDICQINRRVLDEHRLRFGGVSEMLAADLEARRLATELVDARRPALTS